MKTANYRKEKVIKTENQKSSLTDVSVPVKTIFYILTSFLSVTTLIPLLLTISVSFTDSKSLALDGYRLVPKTFSLEAYRYVLENGAQLWRSYGVTIIVTVSGTILGLFLMTLFSYAISRKYFSLRNVLSFFVFFTMLFNGGMVPTYIIVSSVLGLKDTVWALILPITVNATYIIILRTYMRNSIPDAVVESAKIDGAGEFLCYYKIVLPMAVPSIATIALFMSVTYWNSWYQAFLYISRNDSLVPIQLLLKRIEDDIEFLANSSNLSFADAEIMRQQIPTESFKMALVILVAGPILLLYPFFQRFFVKGITIGAVKG